VDFAYAYTEEQQRFRQEVRDWIAKNVPEEMKDPNDGRDFTEEQWRFWREKHIEMGAMGWLFPTYPSEYGGGGLSGDHEAILAEEFREAQIPWSGSSLLFATLLVWGTEEQRQKFLVPLLKGEKTSWQKLTEPKGGADLANYQSRAVRDGDDWLLTGQNVFIGAHGETEWLFGPMLTDPDAPRHRNLGFFMIPVPSEGLQIREMDLLIGHRKRSIFLDNVRVPGDHLIGGDHQGWQVANTSLEQEHGGRGRAFPRDKVVDSLVEYTKGTEQDGRPLGSDPMVQQTTMNNVIEAHVQSLLLKRTFWMYQSQMHINYEGNVANVHGRESSLRIASRVRDVMGMYALLGTKEPGAPHEGAQEVNQRGRAGQNHAGGSTNIAKVVLARRIGVSRTREQAAPTPSTATGHGS
jgi:alkylation response protein AidB-like acyl-CoA dehydrogenase